MTKQSQGQGFMPNKYSLAQLRLTTLAQHSVNGLRLPGHPLTYEAASYVYY